ncbi:MAG: murein biosynthesis integral membrane protein MurJ [Candidatus Buchananbacteria bacterium RIFCSPLOWO2_01_FULL_39_33]|uniref:Probable lipid II flippase MurJ n=1 Tax=Candidatus Buchananbacteria bacterium RIFCSPLOWO2_01_FULL_39_33 TaxID=1797543 RepID=A0A1G1YMU1_9BACT|nr:MAG: murein biosynthesis integral membrane protein MurJ [Candidatus Buchananbacteria bacterium RIFCSPHIGHO2_01_FULL_40_35]OGY53116.1 MAG: murein biosynthesis integral membrane protein MurJ [Candidatus Buchananbacteria bacterium RIFCSPLOWO2_01_FULL_39_33]
MFNKLINSQAKTITSAAIIIGALSLISRILGIFRDRILAAQFGAGDTLDAYYAAFRLPDLVYNILILGAISAGLIPVFTGLIVKKFGGENEAWKLINSVLNLLFLAVVVICALLFLSTPYLMPLITPGFSQEKMAMVISLSKIMFLSPIFLGLSAIFGSILQSFRRFFVYSLAPIFYNVGIIIGALYLVDYFGIYGLAWGVVLGSFFHLLVQIPPTFSLGYKYQAIFNWRDKNVRKVGRLLIPRTLTLIINQVNFLVVTVVGSTLAVGSLAIFNLSNNLQSFPLGIFGVSLAVAALPILSTLAVKNNLADFVSVISSTFRQTLFFIIPISILLYVLRAQIVRIILGSGAFSWLDTRLTAATLAIFALGLFAQGTLPLLVRGFYALHDTKTPFYIGLLALIANLTGLVFFAWVFSWPNWFSFFVIAELKMADLWSVADLRVLAMPLAISFSSLINLFFLLLALRRKIGRLDGRKILDSSMRIIFASLGAGLFTYASLQLLAKLVMTETFLGLFFQGFIAGSIGLLGYWLLGYLLNMAEMAVFVSAMQKKLFRAVKVAEDTSQEGEGV